MPDVGSDSLLSAHPQRDRLYSIRVHGFAPFDLSDLPDRASSQVQQRLPLLQRI